jgi:hypothetical protein
MTSEGRSASGWAVATAALVAVVALATSGCGDDSAERTAEDEREVGTVVRQLQRAFLADDTAAICARMTRAAQRQAGIAAHNTPTTCPKDVRGFFAMIEQGGGWRHRGEPELTGVAVDGDRATATVAVAGWRAAVPLAREDGRWKLNSFFGAAADRPPKPTTTGAATPAAERGSHEVAVRGAREGPLRPCGKVSAESFAALTGGCRIELYSRRTDLSALTVFGDFRLASCWSRQGFLVDGSGRTWTDSTTVEADIEGERSACGDVNACGEGDGVDASWLGRIEARPDGDLIYRSKVCFETCIGDFAGVLTQRLVRRGRDWRAETVGAGVGASGFRVDSRLDLTPDGLAIARSDSPG